MPPQLEFFFGGDNENFVNQCNFIGLDKGNNKLISFLFSDMRQNMMIDNSLSIHLENRNIFFMKILTQMKIFISFYGYNKLKQNNFFQNVFRTTIVLRGI